MIDILHNDGFPAPIIVFVNQKKTADMVCKDIQRAGVRFHYFFTCLRDFLMIDLFLVPRYYFTFWKESRAA